jgi:Protein of unknown function (DUF3460)
MATKNYESETTKFLREFLEKHPEVVEKQKKHRATWWDRPQDLRTTEALESAKVPKKPYEYYG